MLVESFFDKETCTYSYLVFDSASRKAAVIDPVLNYDASSGRTHTEGADHIIARLRSLHADLVWLLETHVHADHLTAAPYLHASCGGKLGVGEHIRSVQKTFGALFNAGAAFVPDGTQFHHLFKDGEVFHIGSLECRVMHTPGHTPACLSYVIQGHAFVGDTLFMPDYGTARCDFPGGNAEVLFDSIQKIYALPDDTKIMMCHDYMPNGRLPMSQTTVAEQKKSNLHVHEGVTKAEFVKMRTEKDRTLGMPLLMLPAVQVNMRAGHFPEPESNGIRYLKIPLNVV
jgi:glyoxylase-like metal-dependent hydrolase (beta-lactamase superfamily II)